ncbi:MAG: hypothetical protein ACOZQL_41770 [Myxococcota bacterium]
MSRPLRLLTLGALVIASLTACGSESTPPKPDGAAVVDQGPGKELGTSDGTVKPDGVVAPDGASKPDSGPAGKTVLVLYGGASTPVDVSKPTQVPLDGTTYSRLSDVVLLALPGKSLAALKVDDFEGSDGFKSSAKANCVGLIPLAPADKLAKGYVHPTSLNMRWDDDLGFPSCMTVKGLAKIHLSDK